MQRLMMSVNDFNDRNISVLSSFSEKVLEFCNLITRGGGGTLIQPNGLFIKKKIKILLDMSLKAVLSQELKCIIIMSGAPWCCAFARITSS